MTQIELLNKTVERLQADLAKERKTRLSEQNRVKAFQKHMIEWREKADYWKKAWETERQGFKDETAAHIKTLRERDWWRQEARTNLGAAGQYASMTQKEIDRGDLWQRIALTLAVIPVALAAGYWFGG